MLSQSTSGVYRGYVVYPGEAKRPLELQHTSRVPVQVQDGDVLLVRIIYVNRNKK